MNTCIRIGLFLFILATLMPFHVHAEEDEFLLGLIPEENIFRQVMRHKPLAEYLSERLGVKVRFTILSRYPHIISRFVQRDLDGAFFGIFTAVLAEESLGVVPIARTVNLNGSSTAKSYIFTTRSTGIKTLADMRGKKAAFVDKYTATGFLYTLAYLRERGIRNPESFFSDYYFSGSHDTTVYTVLAGRAEIGTVKGRILDKLGRKDPVIRDDIYIIAKSMDLPDNTLCIRSDIPAEFKQKLTDVLLSMHKDKKGRKVLEELDSLRFIAAGSKDFKPVRNLATKAGIDLKKFK